MPPLLLSTANTFSVLCCICVTHLVVLCLAFFTLHPTLLVYLHILKKSGVPFFLLSCFFSCAFLLCLAPPPPPPASAEEPCVQEDPPSSDLPYLLHHAPQFRGVDGHHAHLLLRVRGSAVGHRPAGYALCGVRSQSAWEMPRAAERWLSAKWVIILNYRKTETQKRWTTNQNTYLNVLMDSWFCMSVMLLQDTK